MNKNAIKKYAVWARRELIERVSQRAFVYGITAEDSGDPNVESVNGHVLSAVEKQQRLALIDRIREKGYQQVMEEVAYTWFNRIAALRFMEVNGYLPSHVRVFTDDTGAFKPQILSEAIHLEMDGLNMATVYELENANKREELFKYLLIVQCNALNSILPGMFQKIEDYTELLLPDNLLREGSVIEQMVMTIPEEDWQDQVQIIGWLYQYYNSELKDEVFANLKKKIKIDKNHIPAATQLFTPDWIVRYMVENSLGRLWVEGHPDDALKANWQYYLEEAEQEQEVQAKLAEIRKEYAALAPEDILCIDPCMGSGHILIYMFDVLLQIYQSYGYSARDAVKCIIQKNLWGLDIDERAAQLAYFSVMMKARQYDRRFFKRDIQPNVFAVAESNDVPQASIDYFAGDDEKLKDTMMSIVTDLNDAKEYGSIIHVTPVDFEAVDARLRELKDDDNFIGTNAYQELLPLVNTAKALSQKYHAVVTNPPYMGGSGMNPKLSKYVKKNYSDSKSDLFAVFIEKCISLAKENNYVSMITQQAWMFLSSYEELRTKILHYQMTNMVHLGSRAFDEIGGEVVQTTSFVFRRKNIEDYLGTYCRLISPTTEQGKEDMFLSGENRYISQQDNFSKIQGSPIAYWISNATLNCFNSFPSLGKKNTLLAGTSTGDNKKYQRIWHEVSFNSISKKAPEDLSKRWYPCNTGGEFRKYSLNDDYVIDWENDGYRIKHHINSKGKIGSAVRNRNYYFRGGITWNKLSSSNFGVRLVPDGYISDDTARMIVVDDPEEKYSLLGFLCSKVCKHFLQVLSPTMSFTNSELKRLPLVSVEDKSALNLLVEQNIKLSFDDRASFETSWDFTAHPLVRSVSTLKEAYAQWEGACDDRFNQLKANEEELNRIFIDIYGLQDELTPEVEDKDVTVRKADLQRDIKSLISYAVGCMFGRYSLDVPGLVYAGGQWDNSKYQTIIPDDDGVLPICDDEYFDDDIVGKFIDFIRVVYGEDTLDQNLKFIADALGGKGTAREIIRNYFIKDFYKDHCKTYQKRPIYWLFDSGKKNGFKCLIYMHRYQPDTIARIRTDYVHEQQSRYRTAIADLEQRITGASRSERAKLNKQLVKIQAQAEEIRLYEEKIHHLADQMIKIDLDDGVKHNYAIFQDVLAKIK